MNTLAHRINDFAEKHRLVGLTAPSLRALMEGRAGYSTARAKRFLSFQERIEKELLSHRIIRHNPYTAWFKQGEQNMAQIKAFIIQFSVFSNQFLVAQLLKTINADSLESMRASKEILANEIGVVFNSEKRKVRQQTIDPEREGDPELVSTDGTVEGGSFRFRAAHFEWLLQIANKLGLDFNAVGKRAHGTKATLFFCDELIRLYGSEAYTISQAASYAVENWAAAGFWEELIAGLTQFKARTGLVLPLAFFTWHNRLEVQHARHTREELEEAYFTRAIDEEVFIHYGQEMLEGVAVFWEGLDQQRRKLAAV